MKFMSLDVWTDRPLLFSDRIKVIKAAMLLRKIDGWPRPDKVLRVLLFGRTAPFRDTADLLREKPSRRLFDPQEELQRLTRKLRGE